MEEILHCSKGRIRNKLKRGAAILEHGAVRRDAFGSPDTDVPAADNWNEEMPLGHCNAVSLNLLTGKIYAQEEKTEKKEI